MGYHPRVPRRPRRLSEAALDPLARGIAEAAGQWRRRPSRPTPQGSGTGTRPSATWPTARPSAIVSRRHPSQAARRTAPQGQRSGDGRSRRRRDRCCWSSGSAHPAWRQMEASVPGASSVWRGTITVLPLSGWRSLRWLPRWPRRSNPALSSAAVRERPDTTGELGLTPGRGPLSG